MMSDVSTERNNSPHLRCLHIFHSLDFGGVETRAELIFDSQQDSDFRHYFCAIGHGGQVSERMRRAGADVFLLGKNASIPSIGAVLSLVRCVRTIRPQVIHLRGAEANFHGIVAAWLCNVPVMISEEIGIPRHSALARFVFRHLYRLADGIVAISEAVKARIVEIGEAPENRVTVIYNPVRFQRFRVVPPFTGKVQLGFVGRLEEVKNPIAAIEAVALLAARGFDVSLRVVGNGSQMAMLARRVSDLGLDERVELVGSHPSPFSLLRDCHLYLQPSITEGFGLAVCEAMSAGIPPIVSAVGGVPEIVRDGETGWLLHTVDAECIAQAVEKALKGGHAELVRMGRLGCQSVSDRFSSGRYIAECDALYNRLLDRTRMRCRK